MYTGSETYMDKRTVPMNKAPTVLSTGNNAGIVDNQAIKSERTRVGRNIWEDGGGWKSQLPKSQQHLAFVGEQSYQKHFTAYSAFR